MNAFPRDHGAMHRWSGRLFLALLAILATEVSLVAPDRVGYSPFHRPAIAVEVIVDSSSTISSGGTLDWNGRASIVRRSDGTLVAFYKRGASHQINDGGLYVRFSEDDGASWSEENRTLAGSAVTGFPMNPGVRVDGEDAGEPWAVIAPNGDVLLFMWRVEYRVSTAGTYMSRSTDGGSTWGPAAGPIQFGGLNETQNNGTLLTDDGFVLDDVIYAGARVYADADGDPSAVILCRSEDNGETWAIVSTLVADTDMGGHGTQEVGLAYVKDAQGNGRIVAILRDDWQKAHAYRTTSSDLGLSWSPLTDATAEIGIIGRPRIYSRSALRGLAHADRDPGLVMVGFTFQTPGKSHPRRNGLWISRDRGTTWDGPFYLDVPTQDAGYGDIFYDARAGQYVVWSYQGTVEAAALKQYRVSIAGF